MILTRRGLFAGATILLAAPAIVRVTSLMPVSVPPLALTRIEAMLRETMELISRKINEDMIAAMRSEAWNTPTRPIVSRETILRRERAYANLTLT